MTSMSFENDTIPSFCTKQKNGSIHFSLERFIIDISEKKTFSDDEKSLLRRFLRKAEITRKLHCHYIIPSYKPAPESSLLNPSVLNAFLNSVLKYYQDNRDAKVLNGFFKVFDNAKASEMDYYPSEDLLIQAENYLEDIKI